MILLADGPRWIQLAGLVLVALFLWDNVDKAHVGVEGWTAGQQDAIAAVDEVARLDPARCPVYMARFHAEDADAYPELIALEARGEPAGRATRDSRASWSRVATRFHPLPTRPSTQPAPARDGSGSERRGS